jgi:hypothetical protein
MDILAPVPKTPSKPVPPVLILPDYRTQTLPSANPREPPKIKIPCRMIIPFLRKPPPLISSFTALSPHLLPYLHIVNAPYPIIYYFILSYLLSYLIPY